MYLQELSQGTVSEANTLLQAKVSAYLQDWDPGITEGTPANSTFALRSPEQSGRRR